MDPVRLRRFRALVQQIAALGPTLPEGLSRLVAHFAVDVAQQCQQIADLEGIVTGAAGRLAAARDSLPDVDLMTHYAAFHDELKAILPHLSAQTQDLGGAFLLAIVPDLEKALNRMRQRREPGDGT